MLQISTILLGEIYFDLVLITFTQYAWHVCRVQEYDSKHD